MHTYKLCASNYEYMHQAIATYCKNTTKGAIRKIFVKIKDDMQKMCLILAKPIKGWRISFPHTISVLTD